jgi:hypothetical protein
MAIIMKRRFWDEGPPPDAELDFAITYFSP